MFLPIPIVGVTSALLAYVVIALSMIGVTVFVLIKILPRQADPPLLTQVVLGLSVIFGGSVLLLALLYVFLTPDGTTAWTWVLLAFNFMMMFPAGFWFVTQILFEDRAIAPASWAWPVTLGLATTGSEVLMGLLFAVAGANGDLSVTSAFALGLSSIWLYWSMAAVMGALLWWAPLSPVERYGSLALALASVSAPWVTAYPLIGGIAAAAVMIGLFLFVARVVLEHRVSATELGFLLALSALFLAMAIAAAGLVADAGRDPSRLAFGAVMAVGMVGEMSYLVRRCYAGPAPVVPPLRVVEPTGEAFAATHGRPLEPAAAERPTGAR